MSKPWAFLGNDKRFGRLIRIPLRWIPRGTVVPVVQGPLRGLRWVVGSSTHGCWLGIYERSKVDTVVNAMRNLKPDAVIYDVGAHAGYYTLLAATVVPKGKVVAFEPFPANAAKVGRHVALNDIRNVELKVVAVGAKAGKSFFRAGETDSEGMIAASGEISVDVVGIDEEYEQGRLPLPDLVKMDIEGGEADALRGMTKVLGLAKPSIFLATHGRPVHAACIDILTGLGYTLTPIGEGTLETTDELFAEVRPA